MFFHILFIVCLSCVTNGEERSRKLKPLDKNVDVEYTLVGCYTDKSKSRMFGTFYFNARKYLGKKLWKNWPDMSEAIKLCAEQAYTHGFKDMFAVQHYGECWSDKQASAVYERYGKSGNCKQGVGGSMANSVYRMKVTHSSESSTCFVNGRNYSEGNSIQMVNEYVEVEDSVCQQCTCTRGKPAECRTLHYCDLDSKACEKYVSKPGHCCPVCDCFHAGRVMSSGDTWVKRTDTSCVECTCQENGTASCRTRRVFCPLCEYPKPVVGQCCPKCERIDPTLPNENEFPTITAEPDVTFPPFMSGMEKRNEILGGSETWNDRADV